MLPSHPTGLFPVPGDGVLARRGSLILLCSLNASQLADQLLDLLDQAADAGSDGRGFIDAVAEVVEAAGEGFADESPADDSGDSVLAFGPAGAGLAFTVCGGAWAEVTTVHGVSRVEAAHPSMLLRCVLRSPFNGIRGGLSQGDNGAASTDRFSRLDAGIVRAGGLSFYLAGAAPGPAAAGPAEQAVAPEPPAAVEPLLEPAAAWVPDDESEPGYAQAERQATELWTPPPGPHDQEQTEPPEPFDSGQRFEAVLLGGGAGGPDVEPRQPLPKVREPQGADDMASAGMLVLDDGSVYQLDSDYVIGREPGLDPSVAAGQARALRVTDESGIVSRVHARVALDGWQVLVTDLGSANGTRVFLAGQQAEQQLVPQVPMVLTAGSQVDLGGRGFRYESHRGG